MAAIKTFFQVICDKKVHYMYIGELVAYNMEGVTLELSDGMTCTYSHSEVELYNETPEIKVGLEYKPAYRQQSEDRYHRKGDPVRI